MSGQIDERQLRSTKPDYVIYVPKSNDGSTHDTGNEHFLVFDGPDGALMAVWTQSTFEGKTDQRIVFAQSPDEGRTWTAPRTIAGPDEARRIGMASWGFPLVSKSGRIYVLYSRHLGKNDIFSHTTGLMAGIYSDDAGKTWSAEQTVPMPRSIWDNPDSTMPANWIVWQKPLRLSEGKYLSGFTRWVSPKSPTGMRAPRDHWTNQPSVVEFMRFENVDENPAVGQLKIRYLMSDRQALQVGLPDHPEVSVVQEPAIVPLPDGRLFCSLRARTGHPYYTVSADAGLTWSSPEPIRFTDTGEKLSHPCSPCPIYEAAPGEYFLLFHNHDGHFMQWGPDDTTWHRRPICLSRGQFRPGARQPLWFSKPDLLMDHDGVPLGAGHGRSDLAMYASVTRRAGQTTLWYPERKFFLLGKRISLEKLRAQSVPEKG